MDVATATARTQFVALVDVDDLDDADLAGRLAEVAMPDAAAPLPAAIPVGYLPAADLQAGVDAVIAAWAVVQAPREAVSAHRLGARAAALLA
jgi:hypothetical protein